MQRLGRMIWVVGLLAVAGCDDDTRNTGTSGSVDGAQDDAQAVDQATLDMALADGGGAPDMQWLDAAIVDMASPRLDARAPVDAMPPADAGVFDGAVLDAGPPVDAALDAELPVDAAPDMGCPPTEPWSRRVDRVGGVLVFTEFLADPADDPTLEWLELHNTLDVDLDISEWALTDGVAYVFPAGTRVPARGYLVVSAAPDRLRDAAGVDSLGPYDGRLNADGERLALTNNAGRLMDALDWTPGQRWPVLPEGSGRSIVKRAPRAASGWGEAWATGAVGGTPGLRNFAPPQGQLPVVLVEADAVWRHGPRVDDDSGPDLLDEGWLAAPAPFFVGDAAPLEVPIRATADNHFAIYAGGPAGAGLRLVGRDAIADWQVAEDFVERFAPGEHLFFAAWEGRGGDGGPQMLIAQAIPAGGRVIGAAADFEAVIGPPDASPGAGLAAPTPPIDALAQSIAVAAWAPLAARRPQGAGPWGGRVGAFAPEAEFIWPDTFENVSATNSQETYALFRTRDAVVPPPGTTGLPAAPRSYVFRTRFDFAGDPAAVSLALDLLVDDGAVVWLNGAEVLRQNMPQGVVGADTPARVIIDDAQFVRGLPIPSDALVEGQNVLVVAVHQAEEAPADLRFAAALQATVRPPAQPAPMPPVTGQVVINEIMYHPADGDPRGEWIELHNRGAEAIDLSGWVIVDGVRATLDGVLPAGGFGVVAADPVALVEAPIVGTFEGALTNVGERVALLDGCGALVDEVHFHDQGRWPANADGYGPSLELSDPTADNAVGAAWAASAIASEWADFVWEGPAGQTVVGPDGQWEELVMGLLDAGEVLLDDVSVIADPAGAAIELIVNGDFSAASNGWRVLGTHRGSAVVADPDDPQNPVLRLVASGGTEHMHNHAEITLADGHRIDPATVYRISFRARWMRGSNQLNTRLYFNRLARTVRIPRPMDGGTPGAPNSVAAAIGPTCRGLAHAPVMPVAGDAATVSVDLSDADGVVDATLHVAVNGAAFEPVAMIDAGGGRYTGPLPTDAPGDQVQFYVEAQDGAGHTRTCPPGGPASRAIVRIDDGRLPADATLPPIRLWMTAADDALLHQDIELMSNDRLGATVVDGDGSVFYDVGVRLKGSQRGRPRSNRLGYSLSFDPEQLFRGVYSTVSLDRSAGVNYGQREMLIDLVMARAGSVSAEYNDLGWLLSPRAVHHGPVQLQLARYGDLMLANQFEDGGDGALYEFELVYYPTTTDDGTASGRKRPTPDRVVGTAPRSLGEDPEAYRHIFQVKNNRRRDDFAAIMAFAQAFDLPDEVFRAQIADVIDVDQWLRAFAFSALCGAVDHFGDGANHNVQFYVRPSDERVLFFPHDLDFYRDARRPVVARAELRRLLAVTAWRRAFYGHLHDVLEVAYNADWLAHWRDHLGALLPGQDFAGHYAFMIERMAYVRDGAPDSVANAIPVVPFAISTVGPIAGPEVELEGTAWIDVRSIVGPDGPLGLTWIDAQTWRATVRVPGAVRVLRLEARGRAGLIAEASIAVQQPLRPAARSPTPTPLFDRAEILPFYSPVGALEGGPLGALENQRRDPDLRRGPFDWIVIVATIRHGRSLTLYPLL